MRVVGCRMDNGTIVDASFCAGQEKPASVQQCVEPTCPTERPTTITPSTTTTAATTLPWITSTNTPPPTTAAPTTPFVTTNSPTTSVPPTTSSPVAAALAGYRPQTFEIHMDPTLNNLDSIWGSSNDVQRIIANWRTGVWGEVILICQIIASNTVNFILLVLNHLRRRR